MDYLSTHHGGAGETAMKNFAAYSVFDQRLAMLGATFITASITFALWHASLLLPV